jgi:hypothetical protein
VRRAFAIALAASLYAGTASAGSLPHDHDGFFIGFNLGMSNADFSTDQGGDPGREVGGAANFRLGGAVKDNLLLGAEVSSSFVHPLDSTVSLSSVLFAVTYYPTTEGFFVRGGMGFGSIHFFVDPSTGYTHSRDENGLSVALATGYELRLTRTFALGPQLEFIWFDSSGDLVDTANCLNATVGFNWYW